MLTKQSPTQLRGSLEEKKKYTHDVERNRFIYLSGKMGFGKKYAAHMNLENSQ